MGQKVNPISLRLRVNRQQDSSWFGDFHYGALFTKELVLRNSLNRIFQISNLSSGRIVIKFLPQKTKILPFIGVSHFFKKQKKNRKNLQLSKAFLRKSVVSLQKPKKNRNLLLLKNASPLLRKNRGNFDSIQFDCKIFKKNKIANFLGDNRRILSKLQKKTKNSPFYSSSLLNKTDSKKTKTQKKKLRSELKNYQRLVSRLTPTAKLKRKKVYLGFVQRRLFSVRTKVCLLWAFQLFFLSITKENSFSRKEATNQLLSKYHFYESIVPLFQKQLSQWAKKRRQFLLSGTLEHLESVFTDSLKSPAQLLPLKINNPYKGADFLAKKIAKELERTRAYRKVLKMAYQDSKKNPFVKGIRISLSGRLGGAELADTQMKKLGPTSLQEFSEQIDYGATEATTKFGILGVKVWICFYKETKSLVK
jgi:hypothetical protein